jgi:hypothetical protein
MPRKKQQENIATNNLKNYKVKGLLKTPLPISLSEIEHKAARIICNSFRMNYNSSRKKIKSDLLISKLKERGYDFSDSDLRRILAFIRRNNLVKPGFILSDNNGYWYSEDFNEMKKVWQSQYGRAIEIMTNFKPLHDMFSKDPKQSFFSF